MRPTTRTGVHHGVIVGSADNERVARIDGVMLFDEIQLTAEADHGRMPPLVIQDIQHLCLHRIRN
ncbi:hypothetical protein DAI22_06g215300 [Oryza sativa Japonica Group]|nr:hypothetical protein DAI22_06g215300 [Oryza sativa Japonica Group]